MRDMKDKRDLSEFPVQVTLPIASEEMGGYSHVKNIFYVRYFESARIQYLQQIGLDTLKAETGIGEIVAQTLCQYLKPLAYPDQIIVGAKVKSISTSSFVMEYLIVSEKNGVSASGEEVIVMYDYNNLTKTELPLVTKEAIEKLERSQIHRPPDYTDYT